MFVCLIGSSEMSQVLLLFLRDAYSLFTLPQILWSWLRNQLLRCLDKMMNPKKLSSSWWFHLRYDYWPRCQWWWRQQVGVLYKSPVPGNHNTIPILQPNFLLFSRCRFDMPGCSGSCFRRKRKKTSQRTDRCLISIPTANVRLSEMQIACEDHRLGEIIVYL